MNTQVNVGTNGWVLDRDYHYNGLILGWWGEAQELIVNLNGHTLTVGGEGIKYSTQWGGYFRGAGEITSSTGIVDIRLTCAVPWRVEGKVESVIADNKGMRVGLRLTGGSNYPQVIMLSGFQSNTFSGDTIVSKNVTLALAKKAGATAVKGNIFVNDDAYLRFDGSNQLRKTSNISLDNGSIKFSESSRGVISNVFNKLSIRRNGVLDFSSNRSSGIIILLNDLEISAGGKLSIKGWDEGRTRLLVKRSSTGLDSSLSRIEFENYPPGKKQLINYNKDYWEVSALPEPATYGAILGAAGLAIWAWRRQVRQPWRRRKPQPRLRCPSR